MIEPFGCERDSTRNRLVKPVPDKVGEFHFESRWADISRSGHVDTLAHAEHERSEHPPDRLGKAACSVLRRWARVGEAAVPGRCASQDVRAETVDHGNR